MKGEGKMVLKSKMKWVGLVGLVLSAISLFVHFLLARFTEEGVSEFHSSITIFPRRAIGESLNFSKTSAMYRRLWGPVRPLESLHPDANPRGYCSDPNSDTNGFIFVRIQGGFHEIRNSICDVVVVSRFLNATLVIPELQSTTSSKGISSQFKSFAYLYNEDQFMAALSKDIKVVKTLPKNLKGQRKKKNIPSFKVPYSASPYYYKHRVLPVLKKHSVVELVVSDGGCLQAILPPDLEEYQRLRCRVAFHALRFRQEVQELATKILHRLRAPGQPFVAFDPGMTRDALAYHGCAELFQDVHTELIQHKRQWMIKRGIVKGNLSVNSAKQRLKGSCPLMPEEIGIILRAYGYLWDTIIYVSGGEIFGGQRTLIPLRAMFENVVDRTSLSILWELSRIYGREANLFESNPRSPPTVEEEMKVEAWKTAGPRPRPLPPPPARPKSYNIEGWWGWVAESDNEPDSTVMELRTNAHKLLWEAIDYVICVEADVFIPGFDRDGKGHPNFASLVMGHRLYQSAASKTYRPDRKEVVRLLEEISDHLYHANHTWLMSVRKHLRKRLVDGLLEASTKSKSKSFISHPVPECSCLRRDYAGKSINASTSTPSSQSQVIAALGIVHFCPAWMENDLTLQTNQVAVQRVPVGSFVVGVDLVPIAPVRGAFSIQQDITRTECIAKLRRLMKENGCSAFDLVLHDGSPNVGGAWSSEATSQNALVIDSVKLATQLLAPKGTFVTKIFRSQDYNAVLFCLKELFEKVEQYKPSASRSASAETYLLGFKYKAPAKIDPRLLDMKHLFKAVEPPRKVVDVLKGSKQKRHRDGYEDGDTILRKVSSAADFIWSESPLDILGSVTSITFDDVTSLPIKDHALTTEEVKILCDDLRVLGKQDFKHLLKWRVQIRKALSPSEKATVTTAPDVEKENKEDDDDRILNEMEELTNAMERKKKREKKLQAKKRAQNKVRKATGMQIDAMQDGYTDDTLFSLSAIKGKKDLVAIDSTEYDDENGELADSENEDMQEKPEEASSSDVDSDDGRRRYDAKMEELLDQAYEHYVTKKEGSAKQRKRLKEEGQSLEDVDGEDTFPSDYDSDKDEADQEKNPLLDALDDGEGPTQEEVTNNWFSQSIFAEAVEQGDLEKSDSEDEMEVGSPEEKLPLQEKPKEKTVVKNVREKPENRVIGSDSAHEVKAKKPDDDFEIVPAPDTDSSDDSSSDESEDMDTYRKAEILACAKRMLSKKQREQMLDDAYNKYMLDDEGLPKWFLDEEKKHRRPNKPVTKEEINAMKAQFKEIDARPAKKVAEAKARKKRVAIRKLEKIRKKANTISDQADISDRSKSKQIDQLYKKALPKRPKKEYVVAKKGIQVKVGPGKVRVDARMKKDARGRGTGNKWKGKGSEKKGKNAKDKRGKGSGGKPSGGKPSGGKPSGKKGSTKGRKMGMHD